MDEGSLCIEDQISGQFDSAEACFHLHPQVEAQMTGPLEVALEWPGGMSARVAFDGASVVKVQSGTWHPEFGVTVANRSISAVFAGASLRTLVQWIGPQ